jgi:hypothetical protein
MMLLCSFILNVICLGTFPLNPWCYYSLLLLLLFLLFQISISPLSFLQVWEELSKFKFFKLDLKGEIFFFNLCLLMKFFNYPCFWEMLVYNVFICCVQELFGHCTFNYTHCISLLHITFHLHNCSVIFFNTLHFFFIFLSFACKCLSWFSYSSHNLILAKKYLFWIFPSR